MDKVYLTNKFNSPKKAKEFYFCNDDRYNST